MTQRLREKVPTVLIVGKSNVGKSTLFNKLIGKRKSIVADEDGTTRDAVIDRVIWYDKVFGLRLDIHVNLNSQKRWILKKVRR
ncbi:MAG: GTPase [Fervidobacterium sp.]